VIIAFVLSLTARLVTIADSLETRLHDLITSFNRISFDLEFHSFGYCFCGIRLSEALIRWNLPDLDCRVLFSDRNCCWAAELYIYIVTSLF